MRAIVTGVAGFMGSHLADHLLGLGHEVLGLDDLSGGYLRNVPKGAMFVQMDLRDKHRVDGIFSDYHPAVVYHLAADATEGRSQFTPVECTERNLNATMHVLTAALRTKVERFVYTSSMAVYGNQCPPFRESQGRNPRDVYGIAKAAAEQNIEVLCDVHGMGYTIVRPHNVYGPRQNLSDPYRNVVGIFMNRVMKGLKLYVYGTGKQQRAFSYIDDITPALAKCGWDTRAENQTINIGSDESVQIVDLALCVGSVSNTIITMEHVDWRPREVINAWCDHAKAKKLLDYKDATPLQKGLQQMWSWAKEHGPQEQAYIDMEIKSDATPVTWQRHMI